MYRWYRKITWNYRSYRKNWRNFKPYVGGVGTFLPKYQNTNSLSVTIWCMFRWYRKITLKIGFRENLNKVPNDRISVYAWHFFFRNTKSGTFNDSKHVTMIPKIPCENYRSKKLARSSEISNPEFVTGKYLQHLKKKFRFQYNFSIPIRYKKPI